MTTDDEAFRRAVIDRPADDLPRVVYADWLDERGDPRGEFIRVQVELSTGETRDPEGLEDRERDMLYRHRSTWLNRLGENWRGDAVFERGFVTQVAVGAREFIRGGERWLRLEPIRKVALYGVPECMRDLIACPALACLTALDLRKNDLQNGDVEQLVRSSFLSHLLELDLSDNNLGPAASALLANTPSLAGLKALHFGGNYEAEVGDDAVSFFGHLMHPWRYGGSRQTTRRRLAPPPPSSTPLA